MSYDNAVVITTAPSERQVREILWRELRRLYMPLRDIIGGKLTRTRLEISPTRYAYGFSTNTEDRFQGFHSGNILVIVDEASGVDEFIYNAIDGVTTANNSKLLLIGNPHGYAGTFYDAFHKNRTQFHTVHISAFDLPAFKAQSITENNIQDVEYPDPITDDTDVIPAGNTVFPAEAGTQGNINYADSPHGLSTPKWAIRVFNSHGPQSSIYQTRVLGQFPDEADDTLIPLRDVEAAVKRQTQIPPDTTPVMGVDVARFGNDKTVIIIRHGPRVIYIDELRKSDIVNTTGAVITAALKYQLKDIIVDEIGVGAGVLDNLKADKRFNAQGLNGSNAPIQYRKIPQSTRRSIRRVATTVRRRRYIYPQRSRIDFANGFTHIQIQRTRTATTRIQRRHQIVRATKPRQSRRHRPRIHQRSENARTQTHTFLHRKNTQKPPISPTTRSPMARLITPINPLSLEPSPSPSQGEFKGGPRVRVKPQIPSPSMGEG